MYVLHAKFVIQPGHEAEYERWKVDQAEIQLGAPGFVKRLVLRDRQQAGVYYYLTFWQSEEQMRAFDSSEELAAMLDRYGQPGRLFAAPAEFAEVEVLADEGSRIPRLAAPELLAAPSA